MRVPTRASWNTVTESIQVEELVVFGWKVRRHLMPIGSKLVTMSDQPVERSRSPNRAMYVRGRAEAYVNGVRVDDRVPGLYTAERPSHPAGKCEVVASEPTEFWCFNWLENGRKLPELTPVRLQAGDILRLDAGQLLLVMLGAAGSLVGPCTQVAENPTELRVTDDLYAFHIEKHR